MSERERETSTVCISLHGVPELCYQEGISQARKASCRKQSSLKEKEDKVSSSLLR